MKPHRQGGGEDDTVLNGTTLRVYRFLYRQGSSHPVSLHDIQRGLGLSSASLAQYHVKKLLDSGLVKETDSGGFTVDRVVFENMIRIRRSIVPLQIMFCIFFITCLILLLTLFRPQDISGIYIFSVVICMAAIGMFGYEAANASSKYSV